VWLSIYSFCFSRTLFLFKKELSPFLKPRRSQKWKKKKKEAQYTFTHIIILMACDEVETWNSWILPMESLEKSPSRADNVSEEEERR
jgi:hypothetical protein